MKYGFVWFYAGPFFEYLHGQLHQHSAPTRAAVLDYGARWAIEPMFSPVINSVGVVYQKEY